jgi:hypothetical protein
MSSEYYFVYDQPYCLWTENAVEKNDQFLSDIDPSIYDRQVKNYARRNLDKVAIRREISPLVRLFWHHSVETLLTLIGAALQAPRTVFAFFPDCSNQDVRNIAKSLYNSKPLEFCVIYPRPANFEDFSRFCYSWTKWANDEDTITFVARALNGIVGDYLRDGHRLEFNSIKHGLRMSTGETSFSMKPNEGDAPGIKLSAKDSSRFMTIVPIDALGKEHKKIHRQVITVTTGWSLEKSIKDISLVAMMIGNVISLIRCLTEGSPSRHKFHQPVIDADWEAKYFDDVPQLQNMTWREGYDFRKAEILNGNEIKEQWRRMIEQKV